MTDQTLPALDKQTQLVCDLLDQVLKLRYENAHMLGILGRMGIAPNFPQYGKPQRKAA